MFNAHIFGRRRFGDREEIRMKLFDKEGNPLGVDGRGGLSVQSSEATLSGSCKGVFGEEQSPPYFHVTPWVEWGSLTIPARPCEIAFFMFGPEPNPVSPDEIVPLFQLSMIIEDAPDPPFVQETGNLETTQTSESSSGEIYIDGYDTCIPVSPITAKLSWRLVTDQSSELLVGTEGEVLVSSASAFFIPASGIL